MYTFHNRHFRADAALRSISSSVFYLSSSEIYYDRIAIERFDGLIIHCWLNIVYVDIYYTRICVFVCV